MARAHCSSPTSPLYKLNPLKSNPSSLEKKKLFFYLDKAAETKDRQEGVQVALAGKVQTRPDVSTRARHTRRISMEEVINIFSDFAWQETSKL